jgi:hypothetical protein
MFMRTLLASATLGAGLFVATWYVETLGGPAMIVADAPASGGVVGPSPKVALTTAPGTQAAAPQGTADVQVQPAAQAVSAFTTSVRNVQNSQKSPATIKAPQLQPAAAPSPAGNADGAQSGAAPYGTAGTAVVEQRPFDDGRMSLGASPVGESPQATAPAASVARYRRTARSDDSLMIHPLGRP